MSRHQSPPSHAPSIDLNADIGEAQTPEHLAREHAVIRCVTSVNIACGGHAGTRDSMRDAVLRAHDHGCAIGAHPSYPDRQHFGRRPVSMASYRLEEVVYEQISVLAEIANSCGWSVTHVKPHGALYHAASIDEGTAVAVYAAICRIDPKIVLIGQAGSKAVLWWSREGARVVAEAFADRVYEPSGQIRDRVLSGSLISDPELAATQALSIATGEGVLAHTGDRVSIEAQTLCVHSDTPGAEQVAMAVQRRLQQAGVEIWSFF